MRPRVRSRAELRRIASPVAGVVHGFFAPGRDPELSHRLIGLGLVQLVLVLNRRAALARPADHRSEEHEKEGDCEAGQPNPDAISACTGVFSHCLEAMARDGTMQADALTLVLPL